MDQTPLLRIENLVTTFSIRGGQTLTAVDGVDLTIPERKIVGLVGESGSGKSVLAMSVMRLIDPPAESPAAKSFSTELICCDYLKTRCANDGEVQSP